MSPAATNVNSALESMSGASTLSRFDLGREIGRGGMAVVHAAVDRETGQRVALKLIERSGGAEESRFVREVKAAIGLNHPGVCRTIAFGTDSTSMFLAMEFVDGDTLNSLAKRASKLPAAVVAEILRQLLSALGAAHRAGVVHRDLKPANVMVTPEGCVKLLDFGIAKSEGDATVTRTGMLVGTPSFMAPEQARCEPIDGRVDLFATGVSAAALLRGTPHRFAGRGLDATQMLLRVVYEPTSPLLEDAPQAPVAIDSVIAGLTAMSRGLRFADAEQALTVLAQSDLLLPNAAADGPAMLARFVKDPAAEGRVLDRALAARERQFAEASERVAGAEVACALAWNRVTLLDPTDEQARARLAAVCAAHKFTFSPVTNARIGALLADFAAAPSNPGVLKRLSDLYRAQGHVLLGAAFLWRYVRERADDTHALQQLRVMLEGPDHAKTGPHRLSTQSIVAGIITGGLRGAAAPVGLPSLHMRRGVDDGAQLTPLFPMRARANAEAEQPGVKLRAISQSAAAEPPRVILARDGPATRESVWLIRAAVVVALIFVGALSFRLITSSAKHLESVAVPPAPIDATVATRVQIDQKLSGVARAQEALARGDLGAAVQLASEVIVKNPSVELGREALFLRGTANARLGNRHAAMQDLELYKANVGSIGDPHLMEANRMLTDLAAGRAAGGLQ